MKKCQRNYTYLSFVYWLKHIRTAAIYIFLKCISLMIIRVGFNAIFLSRIWTYTKLFLKGLKNVFLYYMIICGL